MRYWKKRALVEDTTSERATMIISRRQSWSRGERWKLGTGNWEPQQQKVILNSPDRWLGTDLDACPLHSTTAGSRSHHGLGLPIMPRERTAGPLRWKVNCLRGQFSEMIQKKSPPIRGRAPSMEVSGRLAREAVAFQSRGFED